MLVRVPVEVVVLGGGGGGAVTYRPYSPMQQQAAIRESGVAASLRRLHRMGVTAYEFGMCEHGPVVKCQAQIGRAQTNLQAHGAASFVRAVDGLVEIIEKDRRKRKR